MRAVRAAAAAGLAALLWSGTASAAPDAAALDGWLADSQAFIRGSTMYLRVAAPVRAAIVGYLKRYARYRGR